jgi:hypothetical protein
MLLLNPYAIVAALLAVSVAAQAAVVGSIQGPSGERLLLTDESANCQKVNHFDSYVVDSKNRASATGCWTADGDHVSIDWVEHGRRYWPTSVIDWGRERNSKLRSPTL